jgi:hypothetical protein
VLGSGPTTGIAFVATNNKDPYSGPCTPGPDLCSACLMAVNETTGQWIWWFQANAHDLWDWDCSWWQAAGNQTISGVVTPVIYKTCKNGYLFMLNALTGHLIWTWVPPTNIQPRCAECFMFNPLNRTQMQLDCASNVFQINKPGYNPSGPCPNFVMSPNLGAGFEDEQAFNPQLNMVFGASQVTPSYVSYVGMNATTYRAVDLSGAGMTFTPLNQGTCSNCAPTNNNASIWGINGLTGAVQWHYFIPLLGYRGGVTSTADIVFATLASGHMIALNANNGNLVKDFYIGGAVTVLPSVGATSAGQMTVVVPIASSGTSPGDLVSLTLQNLPGQLTSAQTVTTTTTTTTTAPGTVTTITTTIGGVATTITTTMTGSAATQTVTSTTGGTSSTTLYGVAAVAVIFIIATGYLAMRGRKPTS